MEVKAPKLPQMRILPTGWYCPRCTIMNAPDVKHCCCEEEQNIQIKIMIKKSPYDEIKKSDWF